MKKKLILEAMKKNQKSGLLAVGLMISSVTLIVSLFTKLPDFVLGSLMGIGIGVMILALIRLKQNPHLLNEITTLK